MPALVKAEIVVDLAQFPQHLRAEWDGLREHDVLFLLTIADPVNIYIYRYMCVYVYTRYIVCLVW